AGGGGIDGDGDGGTEGSDRAQRCVLRAVQRSGKPFLADAEGGRHGGLPSPHAGGAGVARVQMIPAYSPQARGRSERNFSTWQGRLPQELRLHGVETVEAANQFLREHYVAEFNRRFRVSPQQPGSASLSRGKRDLDQIFSFQFE